MDKVNRPEELKKKDLKKLYDICNQIFKKNEDCFYSKEEVKQLQKNKENVFL